MIMAKAERTPIKFHGRVDIRPVVSSPPTRNLRTVAPGFSAYLVSGLFDLFPGS